MTCHNQSLWSGIFTHVTHLFKKLWVPVEFTMEEPGSVTSLVSGPAFSHIPSLAHAAFQGVPSLQTSLPSSASQEMITNNDSMQDLESIVSGVSQLLRPVGLAPASVGGVSGMQSLDGNNNAAANLPLSQQTSSSLQSALSKYVKVWEGNLSGQRQGQPVFITRLEGYRSSSASETLAANWPPTMQIVRLISQDHMNNKQYVEGDFLVFRAMNPHGILSQLQEKKLCAVIQLPSQTLLLSVSDKACRLIGMLFPAEPGSVTSLVSGPAFSHIPSLAHAAFQGVPSLQTSLPSSASQEMITNNDSMQDLESIVSGVSQLLRPVGLAPASVGGVSGMQSLDGNNNAAANLPLSQQTSSSLQSALSKYVKVWEGNLSGQRQGQPVFITRLEGYRSSSASETLAANWPPTMQIVRLISQDHMNNKQYVKGDFLVFRAMNPHGILSQLQEKKLCAVIQLPSQTLLLSVSDKACRLIGMLFPAISSQQQQQMQQQQQHPQLQQQQLPQLQQQQQLPLLQQQQQLPQLQQQQQLLQLHWQQPLSRLQPQQQLSQMQQQLPLSQLQTQQQLPQLQQQRQLPQQQQMVGTVMGQAYVQGPGRTQFFNFF